MWMKICGDLLGGPCARGCLWWKAYVYVPLCFILYGMRRICTRNVLFQVIPYDWISQLIEDAYICEAMETELIVRALRLLRQQHNLANTIILSGKLSPHTSIYPAETYNNILHLNHVFMQCRNRWSSYIQVRTFRICRCHPISRQLLIAVTTTTTKRQILPSRATAD